MDLKEYILPKESIIGGWYIPANICDELIQVFRSNEKNQAPGVVGPPPVKIDLSKKASTEVALHPDCDHPYFKEYKKYLEEVIHKYEQKYPEVQNFDTFGMIESPQIQHYKRGEGFKIWHCEREGKDNRCLVFMTFLNTVPEAGTYFKYQNILVPCEKGLTLIWPTDFTHTHKGQVSKEFEKYIITGWLGYTGLDRSLIPHFLGV